MPALIVLGDRTDHGGEVIEASGVTDTYGKRIARIGDKVHCPKKGHGTTVIVEGDLTFVIDGQGAAYHGCRTSCGAILISSQSLTTVEFGSGAGAGATTVSGWSERSANAEASSAVYDEQFQLRDEAGEVLADVPYTVKLPDGRLQHGRTDEHGCSARYQTEGAQTIEIFLGHMH